MGVGSPTRDCNRIDPTLKNVKGGVSIRPDKKGLNKTAQKKFWTDFWAAIRPDKNFF